MSISALLNIKNAVVSDNTILSIFNQFWSYAPITNTSSVYAFCVLVISVCMYATGCRNLIYKVLNLAVLSVFVVALWAYLTDVTFIYVVYILTFVSAVVMLFLSVVLMLPSSAISISSTKQSNLLLAAVAGYSQLESILSISLFMSFPVFAYLAFALYRTRFYRRNEEIYGIPKQPVTLSVTPTAPAGVKSLVLDYDLKTFSNPSLTIKAVESCLSYRVTGGEVSSASYSTGDNFARVYNDIELTRYISNITPETFPAYVRVYPKYFSQSYRSLQDFKIIKTILTVFYEFTDFYFKVIEPSAFNSSKLYTAVTAPFRTFISSKSKSLPKLWHDENGWRAQCRFNVKNKGLVIFVFDRPWWSPFQAFRTASNKLIFAETFQKISEKLSYYKQLPGINISSAKSRLLLIINTVLTYNVKFINVLKNNFKKSTFKISSAYVEMLAQLFTTLSIFLIAAPAGYPGVVLTSYTSLVVGDICSESLENLAAIQHQLYVVSPMLMIVSVTGLLVALIGAPLFVSPGHASKKTAHKH